MNIRNISDVITNSSNEVFCYRSDANPEEILKELKKILGPNHDCSGMGGVLEVASTPDIKEEFDYRESYLGLPGGYILVNIDYGYLSDLLSWLQSNLGDPISEEEIHKLMLPSMIEKNSKLLEQLKTIVEATDDTVKIFARWYSSCYDVEVGGGTPEMPKDKIQLFIDYYENKYQRLKSKSDKLTPESEDWYDLQYEMKLYKRYIDDIKKSINETT
jgi:hypothetical protein